MGKDRSVLDGIFFEEVKRSGATSLLVQGLFIFHLISKGVTEDEGRT